ncbi:hypothetical protein KP79_PYT15004 [Mizuhopecten yessoensis]|uniref:Uncharacterized protein n=1 Tax=Mizuhopecten yessoensis TaxID=6573 RepID=A0A210PFJ5_MIZYE|nr:hypothetical protein KP79_PYT15004 [Mizuhopecten yessoensis]
MGLPLADEDQERQGHSEENGQARPLSGVEFNQIISDRLQSTHVDNRRNSLPPGILEHINVKSVCGQILRFMGDEHFSKTCGRHLRCMGDEISHLYWLKKTVMGPQQNLPNREYTLSHNSHSLPDLRSAESDQQRDAVNNN